MFKTAAIVKSKIHPQPSTPLGKNASEQQDDDPEKPKIDDQKKEKLKWSANIKIIKKFFNLKLFTIIFEIIIKDIKFKIIAEK